MKKLITLTNIASIGAVLALISASEATAASADEISRKEALLAQSGFKVITVTTPKQKEAVNGLAQGRCSAVKYNGKLFYVFPTATKDKFYVGKQKHYNTYKKAIAAQKGSQPAKM
jgi:ligand-binding sensor domain-containing protein